MSQSQARRIRRRHRDKDGFNWPAIYMHWDHEIALFNLKPWQCPPVLAFGEEPRRGDTGYDGWDRAVALRAQLLAANPHHYDDIIEPEKKV